MAVQLRHPVCDWRSRATKLLPVPSPRFSDRSASILRGLFVRGSNSHISYCCDVNFTVVLGISVGEVALSSRSCSASAVDDRSVHGGFASAKSIPSTNLGRKDTFSPLACLRSIFNGLSTKTLFWTGRHSVCKLWESRRVREGWLGKQVIERYQLQGTTTDR